MVSKGNTVQFPPSFGFKDVIGVGNVGLILPLDVVIKIPHHEGDQHWIDIERQVYERLGSGHEGVLRYHGSLYNGILLQRASHGSLRQHFKRGGERCSTLQIRWIQQILETIVFIHSRGILHGDISCNNIFLDENLNAKVGDFAGSSIDGLDSLVCYETRYDHPSTEKVSFKSEIFALGSLMYEILTGSRPYEDLSDRDIETAYAREDYPDLRSLTMFKDVISKCWHREYADTSKVLLAVNAQGKHTQLPPLIADY